MIPDTRYTSNIYYNNNNNILIKFPIPKSSSTQYQPKPNCFICLEHLPIHVSHAYCPKYVRKVIDPSSPSMRQNFMAARYHTQGKFLCHFMGYRDNNLHHTSRCLSPFFRIYFFDVCDFVLVLIFCLCVL